MNIIALVAKQMRSACYTILFLSQLLLWGCGYNADSTANEDEDAKRILQGIWISEDEETPSFMAKGDTIFYPDTTSVPVKFWVHNDSIYLKGNRTQHYKIVSMSEQALCILNQNEENIKLVRGDEKRFLKDFEQLRPYALNVFRVSKTDTVDVVSGTRFECKMLLVPSSERVIKSLYNDDGIEVDNVYLDNVGHLNVYANGALVYVHAFRKQEFSAYVPKDFLVKSILRSLQYSRSDVNSVYIDAVIGIPDAATCYVVELRISKDGKLQMKLK